MSEGDKPKLEIYLISSYRPLSSPISQIGSFKLWGKDLNPDCKLSMAHCVFEIAPDIVVTTLDQGVSRDLVTVTYNKRLKKIESEVIAKIEDANSFMFGNKQYVFNLCESNTKIFSLYIDPGLTNFTIKDANVKQTYHNSRYSTYGRGCQFSSSHMFILATNGSIRVLSLSSLQLLIKKEEIAKTEGKEKKISKDADNPIGRRDSPGDLGDEEDLDIRDPYFLELVELIKGKPTVDDFSVNGHNLCTLTSTGIVDVYCIKKIVEGELLTPIFTIQRTHDGTYSAIFCMKEFILVSADDCKKEGGAKREDGVRYELIGIRARKSVDGCYVEYPSTATGKRSAVHQFKQFIHRNVEFIVAMRVFIYMDILAIRNKKIHPVIICHKISNSYLNNVAVLANRLLLFTGSEGLAGLNLFQPHLLF